MAVIGALVYQIKADVSELVKNTNEIGAQLTKMESMAGRAGTAIKAAFGAFGASEIGKEVVSFVRESIEAFSDAELSAVRLGAAINAQGMSASVVRPYYLDLAESLQKVTIYEHEAAEAAETMLVQIGGVLPSQMPKALKATADLAAGLGKDLPEAAKAVALAFAGNSKALARLMPELKELQKEGMTTADVLNTIDKHFGGQAAAQVDTYAGSVKQLGNFWNDVKEEIGGAIAQDAAVQKFLANIKDGVHQVALEMKNFGVGGYLAGESAAGGGGTGWMAGLFSAFPWLNTMVGQVAFPPGSEKNAKAAAPKPEANPAASAAALAAQEAKVLNEKLREQYADMMKASTMALDYGRSINGITEALRGANSEWEETEKHLKAVAETTAWASDLAKQYRAGIGSPGDEFAKANYDRDKAEAAARKEYDDAMKKLAVGKPYMDEKDARDAEARLWEDYQKKLREIYEEWIGSAKKATDATNQLADATSNFARTLSPERSGAGTPAGAGSWVIPGMQSGLNNADFAMYKATLDTIGMGNGPNRDAYIATKLAGMDMSNLGRGGFTVNINQGMAFNPDPGSMTALQRMVEEAVRQMLSRYGMH